MCVQVGISAPQGCGKSTLVEQLQALLISNGHNAATASIDDFYLSFQVWRRAVALRACARESACPAAASGAMSQMWQRAVAAAKQRS